MSQPVETIRLNTLVLACSSLASAQQVCGEWGLVDPPAGATLAVTEVQARTANDAFAFAIPLGLVRWDGVAWSQFPIPDPHGEYPVIYLTEFGLVGPTHLFLAGMGSTGPFSTDQVLKFWDGSSWSDWHSLTLQPDIAGAPRNGAASAVVGAATDDVWIIGNADGLGTGGGGPVLTVHWDGASRSPIPNPTDDSAYSSVTLNAVTAVASEDVWAAGGHGNEPLFMHWDGIEWTVVSAPETTGTIHGLAAIASDDVWAVDHAAQVPVIGKFYHWDGVAWSIVPPPDIPGAVAVERHGGLAAVGDRGIWAVGSVDYGSGPEPLIERLQGAAGWIFADGFESGDGSAWSFEQP